MKIVTYFKNVNFLSIKHGDLNTRLLQTVKIANIGLLFALSVWHWKGDFETLTKLC